MSRRIFSLFFLLLFVCCQLCQKGRAAQSVPLASTNGNVIDEFLKPEDNNIKEKLKTTTVDSSKISVKHIDLVSLVSANGVIFAMAEVKYTFTADKNITVLAKYFETEKDSWGDEAFGVSSGEWKVELGAGKVKDTSKDAVIKSFAVATKRNTIYHITVSNSPFEESGSPKPLPPPPPAKWHVRVVEGTVNGVGGGTGKKEIKWEIPIILGVTEEGPLNKLNEKPTNIPPSDGFAFVSGDDSIFFFMKGKENGDDGGDKSIIAVFQLGKESSVRNFKLQHVTNIVGCYPSFFEWEEEIIMAPGPCQDEDNQNVKIFNKQDKTFDVTDKPIARLRDFLKDKNNFTTAKIGDINVLLCTQQKDVAQKSDVYLWMTDGTRVRNVGTIVEKIEDIFDGSVLYTKDELITLHQKYNTGSSGDGKKKENTFSLKRLKEQLKNIKLYLKEWKKSNETVSTLCENTKNTNVYCTTSPPTAGLVGFLHEATNKDSSTDTIIWKDMYYYSDVTVNKGENVNKVPNGLKFSGAGKGAEWPMKNEQNEILYNFTDPGFTLVATVEIGSDTNSNDNSILGMKLTPNTNSVGLWCTTEGKWGVSYGDDSTLKIKDGECKKGNTYNAAFVLGRGNSKNLEIYVNGEKLTTEKITIEPSEKIEKFYFGARIESDESHVTVTNVLLYNRPFNGSEIGNLKNYVKSVEAVTPPDQAVGTNTTPQGGDDSTTLPQGSTGEENKDVPSPSRTEDGGVGGGVRVFSLLLAVLCVSAPLLHL